ncbi:hypothetical protein ABK905_14180 [Acerihabitans sp. KWT182]|uniref:Uncharacterized protein n=1 Tax=Acerihabitans sp. KWT182 TaxID=3157919 RepID=A0AAU7Q4E9_9GAMM
MFTNHINNINTINPDAFLNNDRAEEFANKFTKALDIRETAKDKDIYPALEAFVEGLKKFSSTEKTRIYKEIEKNLADRDNHDVNYLQNDRDMLIKLLECIVEKGCDLHKSLGQAGYSIIKENYGYLEDEDIYINPNNPKKLTAF